LTPLVPVPALPYPSVVAEKRKYDVAVEGLGGLGVEINHEPGRKPAVRTTSRAIHARPRTNGSFIPLIFSAGGMMTEATRKELETWGEKLEANTFQRMKTLVSIALLKARARSKSRKARRHGQRPGGAEWRLLSVLALSPIFSLYVFLALESDSHLSISLSSSPRIP
jgi:hypothetical protein